MPTTDQPPSGGCLNCGAAVRTRKNGEWLCANCASEQSKDETGAQALRRAGKSWAKAKDRERDAAQACYAAIVKAVASGMTEVRAAELAGVDRMTVRRALGKL